jgi:hypothetical protein
MVTIEAGAFEAFYRSDLQAPVLLWIAPLLFLAYFLLAPRPDPRGAVLPEALPFLRAWALLFTLETILDPWATGPLLRILGIAGTSAATAVMIVFVLVGDFRVFLWVLRLVRRDRSTASVAAEAAAWTLVVPVVAVAATAALDAAFGPLHANSIWLVYELSFAALALFLRFVWLPGHLPDSPLLDYLEDVVEWVLAYYLLWAAADVLILVAGLDLGWALRVLPNQLYYSFFVPFAYARFFMAAHADPDGTEP